ncbi:hypothetical protein AMTRI_Chr04g250670 [Amborella trichopoda]
MILIMLANLLIQPLPTYDDDLACKEDNPAVKYFAGLKRGFLSLNPSSRESTTPRRKCKVKDDLSTNTVARLNKGFFPSSKNNPPCEEPLTLEQQGMEVMTQNSSATEVFADFIRAFLSPTWNAPERQQGTFHKRDAKRRGYRAR